MRDFRLEVAQTRDGNGAAAVRRLIDQGFEGRAGWRKSVSGDIDWVKCSQHNGSSVCIGVEVQVSGRSDLVAVDLLHLRKSLIEGTIDVGVLIVPDDSLSYFLTDRTPNYTEALRHLHMADADRIPLVLIAFEHDGFGEALVKQSKRR